MHTDDTTLTADLRLLMHAGVLSGREQSIADDYIHNIDTPDLYGEIADAESGDYWPPSQQRQIDAQEIIQRNFLILSQLQKKP